jgi:hypothetical protein
MSDINIRSDSVDVEQIMRQIRARIREKRGADYTETELQQLATVKLQQFLDPKGVRSDLVEQFRRQQPPAAALPNYVFEDTTLFETHRGPLQLIRRLLKPVLKLFFNPNKLSDALHIQAQINAEMQQQIWRRGQMEPLYYEVVHNLVVEITRLGIEVQNLTMRVESLTSRMDFDERRAKALETVVEYKPALARRAEVRPAADRPREPEGSPGTPGAGPAADAERRRRRRRRRRRAGQTAADTSASGAPGSDRGGAPAESGAREPHQAPLPNAGGGDPNGGPGGHDGDDDGEGADDQ